MSEAVRHVVAYATACFGIFLLAALPVERWHPVKSGLFVLFALLAIALVVGDLL